ncbi:hypothetical protein PHSC3_002022 [Chlamydiales bacterium STE3]|nr:hypothetical protein PHSC3_002022 [Chlamydiales bacterium STE3]
MRSLLCQFFLRYKNLPFLIGWLQARNSTYVSSLEFAFSFHKSRIIRLKEKNLRLWIHFYST